jgi:hypothetical protein
MIGVTAAAAAAVPVHVAVPRTDIEVVHIDQEALAHLVGSGFPAKMAVDQPRVLNEDDFARRPREAHVDLVVFANRHTPALDHFTIALDHFTAMGLPNRVALTVATRLFLDAREPDGVRWTIHVDDVREVARMEAKPIRSAGSARSAFLNGLGRVFGLFPQRVAKDQRSDLEVALTEISEAVRVVGVARA